MNKPMTIDSIIAEQIQAQSTIAVNRVIGVTIRPLIKDFFDREVSNRVEEVVERHVIDEIVERHVDDKVQEAVDTGVSDYLENCVELDNLVESAVRERTDNQLYEVVNDVVNELDMDNIISDSRVERAVDAALPDAVANYMSDRLSNYFRSPEGEQVLSDFVVSHAGRTALARTFMTILLEHSNA